jgi:hypothetical protein
MDGAGRSQSKPSSAAVTEQTFQELAFAEQLFVKNQLNCDKQFS